MRTLTNAAVSGQSTTTSNTVTSQFSVGISSQWSQQPANSLCLPTAADQNSFNFGADITKLTPKGKAATTTQYWHLSIDYWTDCTALAAKHTFGNIYGSSGATVDPNLLVGTFSGTNAHTKFRTEACDIICTNSTSDPASNNCNYSNNCTLSSAVSGSAVVKGSWKANGPLTNITSFYDESSAHEHYIVDSFSQKRLAKVVGFSIKIGGVSFVLPAAANINKSGSLSYYYENNTDSRF
jgi:hypothetical protein